jgi:hypothetical protein
MAADNHRLKGFSSGPQQGTYILQPAHMNVTYPSNVDDEFITPTKVEHSPLFMPTSISSLIYRIKLADICREIVDTMPYSLRKSQRPEYEMVLPLDEKFQTYLKELPVFFQLNPTSIQQSQKICQERPNIAWQRILTNSAVHTRLCRLHRPYHLEGSTNPKYAYSRKMCIRLAQTVLELQRSLDNMDPTLPFMPARSWLVVEHVFLAALILASDVSFNPNAPDAKARKAKVLAAYGTLERSKEESSVLMERIQRNLQTLVSTLQKWRPQMPSSQPKISKTKDIESFVASDETLSSGQSQELGNSSMVDDDQRAVTMQGPLNENPTSASADGTQSRGFLSEAGTKEEEKWEQLWSDFLGVTPELDKAQWSSLLDNMDFDLQPDIN